MIAEKWHCNARDAEVLAVAATLDLTWPYPLPGLPADIDAAASLVDAAMVELELHHGETPTNARASDLAFAVATIIEARPRAALYFLDGGGALLGWVGLYYGREQLHGFELVDARGAHEFTIGTGSAVLNEFMGTIGTVMDIATSGGIVAQAALLIDNQREDRARLFEPHSGTFRFVTDESMTNPGAGISWTTAESVALASELNNAPARVLEDDEE